MIVIDATLPEAPPPSRGVARFAAFVLGALERRNALLLSLTSLDSDGNAAVVTTTTSTQKTTIAQRNRTTNRARASYASFTDLGARIASRLLGRFPPRRSGYGTRSSGETSPRWNSISAYGW